MANDTPREGYGLSTEMRSADSERNRYGAAHHPGFDRMDQLAVDALRRLVGQTVGVVVGDVVGLGVEKVEQLERRLFPRGQEELKPVTAVYGVMNVRRARP